MIFGMAFPRMWPLLLAKRPRAPPTALGLQGSWLLMPSTEILGSIQARPQSPTEQNYFSNVDTSCRSGNSAAFLKNNLAISFIHLSIIQQRRIKPPFHARHSSRGCRYCNEQSRHKLSALLELTF